MKEQLPHADQPDAQHAAREPQNEWTRERLAEVATALDAVPDAPQRLTTAQAVAELLPQLRKMRDRGHSHESISAHLLKYGLAVAPRTLARHMARGATRKPARSRPAKA